MMMTFKEGLKEAEESEEAEELDRRFKNLISKKRLESFKEYLQKAEYIKPQSRVNTLRKKINNLLKQAMMKQVMKQVMIIMIIMIIMIMMVMMVIMMIVKIIKLAIL